MSLQFTAIDDAFAPLSLKKKKIKIEEDINYTTATEAQTPKTDTAPPQQAVGQVPTSTVLVPKHTTFIEELFAVQPYINNLFMLLVIGMLYDIRHAAMDCKSIILRST
jgi:hypothetical protein